MTKIWWILIRALKSPKNLLFDLSFLVIFDLKKLSFMTLESDAKFEKKLTCGFGKKTREIWQIFTRALKSLKIRTLMGFFYPKLENYELRIYRVVISHDNEKRCKIGRGINLLFQNWHEDFDEFWPEHFNAL